MGGCYGCLSQKRNGIVQLTFQYELNATPIAILLSLKAAPCSCHPQQGRKYKNVIVTKLSDGSTAVYETWHIGVRSYLESFNRAIFLFSLLWKASNGSSCPLEKLC